MTRQPKEPADSGARTDGPSAATLPASHGLDLVELVDDLGGSSVRLLASVGLTREALEPPEARLSLAQVQQLVAAAVEQTKQPWLGFLLGLRMRVPAHGFLGFAAMTAPTVRDALELAVRFAPIRTGIVKLSMEETEHEATLYFDEQTDFGSARETILITLLTGIWRIGEALTGRELRGVAEFTFGEPPYAELARSTPLAVQTILYARPRNALRFDKSYLALPFAMAHASAFQLAKQQCELALAALDRAGVERQVREALPRAGGGVCTVEEVALKLGTSTRTLQRKLKAEGLAFSELAGNMQEQQARTLLRDERLSVEQVAERVGYSDVSNFTRAFRRWTGETPAAYRKHQHG